MAFISQRLQVLNNTQSVFWFVCFDRCHAARDGASGGALQHRVRHGAHRCEDIRSHHEHAGEQHAALLSSMSPP